MSKSPTLDATKLGTPMLTSKEVAYYLDVSLNKVYQLFKSEGFPAFKIGKLWRVDPNLLSDWVQQDFRE